MKRSGLTMLELSVVIAIIAILASVLMPVFARARERARTISCGSNLANIALALHLYAQDYDGWFPPPNNNEDEMMRLLRNSTIFLCPSQATPGNPPGGNAYFSYKYQPGLRNDGRGNQRLLWDSSFVHSDGANVAFVAGAVKWVSSARWGARGWKDPALDNRPVIPSPASNLRPPASPPVKVPGMPE